jgi:hypothetical protein
VLLSGHPAGAAFVGAGGLERAVYAQPHHSLDRTRLWERSAQEAAM